MNVLVCLHRSVMDYGATKKIGRNRVGTRVVTEARAQERARSQAKAKGKVCTKISTGHSFRLKALNSQHCSGSSLS